MKALREIPGRWWVCVFVLGALLLVAIGNMSRASFGDIAPGPAGAIPFIGHWKMGQYHFNYGDLGFAKRSLVGTVFGFDPKLGATPAMMIVVTAPAVIAAVWISTRLSALSDRWLAVTLLISPIFALNAGYDLGRFDWINVVILLVILTAPHRGFLLLAPLMLLVHEAAAVIHLPLLFTLHIARHGVSRVTWAAGILAVALLASLLILPAPPDQAQLEALYPLANTDALRIHGWTLIDNVGVVLEKIETYSASDLIYFLLGFAYLLLFILVMRRAYGSGWGPIVLVSATPLALSVVGIDVARWIALTCLNLLIALTFQDQAKDRVPRVWLAGLAAFTVIGPIGIILPFRGVLHWVVN